MSWPSSPHCLIRISAQLYDDRGQYARLTEPLSKELGSEHVGP